MRFILFHKIIKYLTWWILIAKSSTTIDEIIIFSFCTSVGACLNLQYEVLLFPGEAECLLKNLKASNSDNLFWYSWKHS